MTRAVKSAFFRLFRTGLLAKVLIISVILSVLIIFNTCVGEYGYMLIRRPRYIDREFIFQCLIRIIIVFPMANAVFCTSLTGNDILFRSINNKIATGISRRNVYLAELIVSCAATFIEVAVSYGIIILFARFWPTKVGAHIDAYTMRLMVFILISCVAFTAFYTLLQFFFSNKLFALIVALLIVPCLFVGGQLVDAQLNEPYRYSVTNEETGETSWELNPEYVGGTSRKVMKFVYDTIPFTFQIIEDPSTSKLTNGFAADVIVIVCSTAAGLSVIKKREFS